MEGTDWKDGVIMLLMVCFLVALLVICGITQWGW